jgi:hypothetical protein
MGSGDRIRVGNVTGSTGVAVGRGARATVNETHGTAGQDLTALFATIYGQIEARPPDARVEKAEITETVQRLEEEAKKGEEANPGKVERWLRFLGDMAPDILDVTLACLTSPAAGIATAFRKVADKAREEAAKAPPAPPAPPQAH